MRSRIRLTAIGIAAGICGALTIAAGALAAPPVPRAAKVYRTAAHALGYKGIQVIYVTSASSGKVIVPGTGGLGGSDGNSEAFLDCPGAKRNPGLKGTPFTDFGFRGATFKLKHGQYSFSKSFSVKNASVLGSPVAPVALKVTITARVASPSEITGTLKATGGPCTTSKPVPYTAKLDKAIPVAPGQ